MTDDVARDQPTSAVVAEAWQHFAQRVLPQLGGSERGRAQVAFYFGALQMLEVVRVGLATNQQPDTLAVAVEVLGEELGAFLEAHGVPEH